MNRKTNNQGVDYLLAASRAILLLSVINTANSFAHDNNSKTDGITEFPNFTVSSNGTSYTKLEGIGFAWEGKFHIHEDTWAGTYKPIKSWKVYPQTFFQTQNGTALDLVNLKTHAASKSYTFPYPTEITKTVGQIFPNVAVAAHVVAACETNAQELRDQGISDAEIFSQNRVLEVDADLVVSMVASAIAQPFTQAPYPSFDNSGDPSEGKITCKKWAGASAPVATDVAIKNGVTDVTLDIEEQVTLGYCGLKLNGSLFTTIAKTTVSYRFEEQFSGKKSQVYELDTLHNLGSGTTGPYPGFFSHKFELPYDKNFETDGKIRMVGVNHSFNTGWQSFSADCNKPIPGQIQVEGPPTLELDVTPEDNVMVDGQICPGKVRMVAGIKAKSNISGKLLFVGNSYISKIHPVNLSNGQNKQYGDYREINWQSSGGIGTEAQSMGNNQPLRTKTVFVGYNIVDDDGKLIHTVEHQQFKITCTMPALSVAAQQSQQSDQYAPKLRILDVAAVTKPKSNMGGSQCGVQVQGNIRTNLPATVKLRLTNHQGRLMRLMKVVTGNNQTASFSTYLDFRKHRLGRWVGLNGKITSTKPQQAGTYTGTLKLSATNLDLAPETLSYQVLCHTTPANGGGIGGLAGGTSQGANQQVMLSAPALTAKKNLVFAKQDAVRKLKKPARTLAAANALTAKPTKKPTRAGDKKSKRAGDKKTLAAAVSVIAKPKKVVDLAVQQLSGSASKGKGVVVVDVANLGNSQAGGSLSVIVKTMKGQVIGRYNARVAINAGDTSQFKAPFTYKKGMVFKVSAKLQVGGDRNPKNNVKNIRLRRK